MWVLNRNVQKMGWNYWFGVCFLRLLFLCYGLLVSLLGLHKSLKVFKSSELTRLKTVLLAQNLWKLNSFIMVIDVVFILTICSYWYQIRHDIEEARTRNATATLNMLLKNYDKRLRPKFGGKPSNFIFLYGRAVYLFYVPKLHTPLNNNGFPHWWSMVKTNVTCTQRHM